jgi:hypothetical protein
VSFPRLQRLIYLSQEFVGPNFIRVLCIDSFDVPPRAPQQRSVISGCEGGEDGAPVGILKLHILIVRVDSEQPSAYNFRQPIGRCLIVGVVFGHANLATTAGKTCPAITNPTAKATR